MRILSFDVGICNLACAVLTASPAQFKVEEWAIIKLREQKEKCSLHVTAARLIKELSERFTAEGKPSIDVVLIENQPVMKNPVMKSIQMVLYSFFMVHAHSHAWPADVRFASAASKLKVVLKPDEQQLAKPLSKDKYTRTKQLAVETSRLYLSRTQQDAKWAALFEASPKKDDLADALLHAVRYIEADLSSSLSSTAAYAFVPQTQSQTQSQPAQPPSAPADLLPSEQ